MQVTSSAPRFSSVKVFMGPIDTKKALKENPKSILLTLQLQQFLEGQPINLDAHLLLDNFWTPDKYILRHYFPLALFPGVSRRLVLKAVNSAPNELSFSKNEVEKQQLPILSYFGSFPTIFARLSHYYYQNALIGQEGTENVDAYLQKQYQDLKINAKKFHSSSLDYAIHLSVDQTLRGLNLQAKRDVDEFFKRRAEQ
jgi:hypothetical protein